MKHSLVALPLVLLLAACRTSPPTHFITLSPVSPVGHAEAAPSPPIQVDLVHLPAVLDRDAVVRQTGANSLSIDDQTRWGAPLGEMTRNVLAEDLARRMPPGAVILPDAPSPPSARHLVVTISVFREESHQLVKLEGSWAVLEGEPPKTVRAHDINLACTAANTSYDTQAAAVSRLLGLLADQIAREDDPPPAINFDHARQSP